MFRRGSPQMRQSEGNKTEKRLSATWPDQNRPAQKRWPIRANERPCTFMKTIECPATAMLAWLARIRSSLLLKTASSFIPAQKCAAANLCCTPAAALCCNSDRDPSRNPSSIAATAAARHALRVGRVGATFSGHDLRSLRQPLAHRSENEPVIPPETFPAAHRLQKKQRQDVTLGQRAAPRAKSNFATAIAAKVWSSPEPIGGVVHTYTSENTDYEEKTDCAYFTPGRKTVAHYRKQPSTKTLPYAARQAQPNS